MRGVLVSEAFDRVFLEYIHERRIERYPGERNFHDVAKLEVYEGSVMLRNDVRPEEAIAPNVSIRSNRYDT